MSQAKPPSLSRAAVRELDRRAIEESGVPGIVLMENAGRGAAQWLLELGVSGPVVICCGPGNNGGDGFVIARHLDLARVDVRIHYFGAIEKVRGDARINFEIVVKSALPLQVRDQTELDDKALRADFASAQWIVDALFGTGLTGPLKPPCDQVVRLMNASPAKLFAVDIPSGLDCDAGQPLGECVRADHTATFVALKAGFLEPSARAWLGQVKVIDMGAPRGLVEAALGRRDA